MIPPVNHDGTFSIPPPTTMPSEKLRGNLSTFPHQCHGLDPQINVLHSVHLQHMFERERDIGDMLLQLNRESRSRNQHRHLPHANPLTGEKTQDLRQLLVHATVDDVSLGEHSVRVVAEYRRGHVVLKGCTITVTVRAKGPCTTQAHFTPSTHCRPPPTSDARPFRSATHLSLPVYILQQSTQGFLSFPSNQTYWIKYRTGERN